jgi:uncharacterized protein (UPF0303 family)
MNAKECLDIISKQEEDLQFESFSYEDAYRLGQKIMAIAAAENLAITADIVLNGFLVFRACRPGTGPGNARWMENKRNTMIHTGRSSLYFTYRLAAEGKERDAALMPASDYAICGGGFPLRLRGSGTIGYACVSGLPHEKDHDVLVRAISAYIGTNTQPTPQNTGF